MGSIEQCYRINTPKVIHETIEGEAIIINFDTGSYYSLDGAGAEIWNLIDEHAPFGKIFEQLQQHYEGEESAMFRHLKELIQQLVDEQLICSDGLESPDRWSGRIPYSTPGQKAVFKPPVLVKFDDMNNLILLDPIHEVDEKGWPFKKEGGP